MGDDLFRNILFAPCTCGQDVAPRRRVLSGLVGMGLATGLSACRSVSSPSGSDGGSIDVHHHHIPPFYLEQYRDRIAGVRGGGLSQAWLSWTPDKAVEAMDASGVETAVLSLTSPGVWFGDAAAARLTARQVNDYAAGLGAKYRGRFGLFAVVPLPDQDGSLKEVEYALDVLKADGVGLMTSYGDKWLGNPAYDKVFEELNRRKAVVFVHPTAPICCRNLMPDVAPMIAEVPQDTARAITNMLFTGVFARYRDIRFIFTHAGGTLPMMIGRMKQYGPANLPLLAPQGIERELARHWFGLAGSANRPAIAALTSFVPLSQIVLGSDNPFVPLAETVRDLQSVGLSESGVRAITRDNARALLPTLRRYG